MLVRIDQEVPAFKSYAAERTRGLYNVDVEDGQRFQLEAEVPIEDDAWQIGVVVGPSGSGKSSIGRAIAEHGFKEWTGGRWPKGQPIIEVLGKEDYAKATAALAAVGLGSVPSWLRPKQVLSTGEQFRAELAQLLLRTGPSARVVVDEFTSVLDRRVAQVGAGAFAKSWRKIPGRRVVLITCHYDILEWVQPDWVVDTHEAEELGAAGKATLRRESLQSGADRVGYPGDRVGAVEF